MPRYQHDCDECRFLGEYNEYDLYHCLQGDPEGHTPTVVARYGSEGWQYTSGINSDHSALVEARTRSAGLAPL